MFTVDHDRYWQSCDAEEADGSSQAGAGARPASAPDTQLWPGQAPSQCRGAHKCTLVTGGGGACQASLGSPSFDGAAKQARS